MSRIGIKPVLITDGVTVSIDEDMVVVKGSQAELTVPLPRQISVKNEENTLIIERSAETKSVKSLHGLIRSLLQNAVTGVSKSWEKKLEVIGTGYRVRLQGRDLVFDVGYSHPVTFKGVENVQYGVQAGVVTISGADRQLVGEIANKIKSIRKPDPYKGKGIRYEGEVLKLKPGKKAKTA